MEKDLKTEKILFQDITFYIDKGQKVAFVAQNGTGKTTMLRIIAGLETPEAGTAKVHKDIALGYLGQDPQFKAGDTILDAMLAQDPLSRVAAEVVVAGTEVLVGESTNPVMNGLATVVIAEITTTRRASLHPQTPTLQPRRVARVM